jgi:Holliday junction resolvasome RuvABC endonuclease subunit
VDNKQWKRDVCGNGNANKDLITKWLADQHPEWKLDDQDQRDAACIALYGQQIVEKADGLKLE